MNRERKVGANYANQHLQGNILHAVKNEQVMVKKTNLNVKDNSKVKIFKNFDDIPDLDDVVDEKGVFACHNHIVVQGGCSILEDPLSAKNVDHWYVSNAHDKYIENSLINNVNNNVDDYVSPKYGARSKDCSPHSQIQEAPYSASQNKIKVGPPKLPIEIERSKNIHDTEIYKNEVSERKEGIKMIDSGIGGNKIPNLSHFRVPLSDNVVDTPELFQKANVQRPNKQSFTAMLDYGDEELIPQTRDKSGQRGIRLDANQVSDQKIGHSYRKSTPLRQKVNNTNDNDDWSEFNEDNELKDQYNKYDNYNYDDFDNNNVNYYDKSETRQQNNTNYTQKSKVVNSKYTLGSYHNPKADISDPINKEMPALPCEVSLSSGPRSNMGPKEQLYFSKQPREVEYKPYTLEQYKLIKPKEYVEISKMKPDLNSEVLIAKRANAGRIKEFSKNLRNFNSQIIGNQQKLPSGSESHEIDNAKKKILSARERAREFAKNIPKPKISKDSYKSVDDAVDLHDDDGYMRVSYEQYGMESKQAKYLEDLEAKYMDSKRNVDAIKRQLK